MRFQKQIYRHNPDNNEWGDCFRTVIACFLDLTPDEVPHFFHNHVDKDLEHVHRCITAWLREWDCALVKNFMDCPLETVLEVQAGNNPDIYYMVSGMSKSGVNHITIGLNHEIVWDPSLDDAGIIGPCDHGYYEVHHLVQFNSLPRNAD